MRVKKRMRDLVGLLLVVVIFLATPFASLAATQNQNPVSAQGIVGQSAIPTPTVTYQAHVQNVGWQSWVSNGAIAGTTGRSLRVEGLRISLNNMGISGGITYQTHVQNVGWQNPVSNGALAGTTGRSLRVEAVRINLTGAIANHFDVYYQVHVQNLGWTQWRKNNQIAGTTGRSLRVEAIRVRIVPQGQRDPIISPPQIRYQAHVQNIGWMNQVRNGQIAGTTGRSLRLEALRIELANTAQNGGVQYRAYVQGTGWQNFVSNNATAGTVGRSLRMEALQIRLTGEVANHFDVYYRVHVQNFGWLGWARNGQSAGTARQSLRIEAVEIRLVDRIGGVRPGPVGNSFVEMSPAQLRVHNNVQRTLALTNRTLYGTYWWTVNNITWSWLPIHVTPPAGFTRAQWYAVLGMENRTGNCFVFAATFYQLARALGYDARYIEGSVGAAGGGFVPHGWVEIRINGNWYIFDPEAQRAPNLGGRGLNFFRQPINRPILQYRR